MNFIHVKSNAVSPDICDELICLFEFNKQNHVDGKICSEEKNIVDFSKKKSTEISIDDSYFTNPLWAFALNSCMNTLSDEIFEYKNQFSDYENGNSILGLDSLDEWCIDPAFNLQKYNPGDAYYSWHCEVGGLKTSQRIMAWMIYLNDVTDGGQTEFKFQNYKSNAEKGKLLIWPSYWTHFHRGIPSFTETKYILTGWISFLEK